MTKRNGQERYGKFAGRGRRKERDTYCNKWIKSKEIKEEDVNGGVEAMAHFMI